LNLKSKKKRKFKKWYTRVDWKAETKNHDMEYLSDKKLLKKFIGTKIEIWDIYRGIKTYLIQKYIFTALQENNRIESTRHLPFN
jgi:hypothetical protein